LGFQSLDIGIEPPDPHTIDGTGNLNPNNGEPGHTYDVLRGPDGKPGDSFSYGPITRIGKPNIGDFLGGKIKGTPSFGVGGPHTTFTFPVDPSKFDQARKAFANAKANPGAYTPGHQCTSTAMDLAKKVTGLNLPSGASPVGIPGFYTKTLPNPYGLLNQLKNAGYKGVDHAE